MSEKLKSKQKLEKAFFSFIEEKPYNKITISEIIEKAGVSRTTFYRHYVDIFDMYDKICKELSISLIDKFVTNLQNYGDKNFVVFFENLCQLLDSQRKYINLLCGKNGGRLFFEHAINVYCEYTHNLDIKFTDEEYFALKFIAMSGIGTYVQTILKETDFPLEYFVICKNILTMIQKAEA